MSGGDASRVCLHGRYSKIACSFIFNDIVGQALDEFCLATVEIHGPRLMAQNDTLRPRPGSGKRHGESRVSSEISALGYWHDDGCSQPVEVRFRNDQDVSATRLLSSFCRIEIDKKDVSSSHQMSSRPAGGPSSHSRSSSVAFAVRSH
jgi:hypothetical protein